MSSKKYPHNEITLGGRLRIFRKTNNYTITDFSKLLDISQGSLSDIENNKTKPSSNPLEYLVHKTDINIYWLFTGEGNMIREDKKGSLYNKVEDEDPEVADLLSRTVEILKSETDYSFSLSANIRSFHHAIRMEKEVSELKSEVSYIKRTMNSKIAALEEHRKSSGKIRKEDPPEEKERFLKKRVM